MKKKLKVVILIFLMLIIILFITPYFSKNITGTSKSGVFAYVTDMINPFVKKEAVYGKIPRKYTEKWKDAANGYTNYGYKVNTISPSGEERYVQVTSFGRELDEGKRIFMISIKGQYVRTYKAVSESNIPIVVLEKIGGMK